MKKSLTVAFAFVLSISPAWGQDDFQLFFGLLHAQTSFSDGRGTPADAYQMAKEAGLDFFAITEHNHNQAGGDDGIFLTPALYLDLQRAADDATTDGEFVAIYGQEFSSISKGNHVNVFNASTVIDVANGDFREFYDEWLPDHPEVSFVQLNHPNIDADRNPNTSIKKRNNDYGIDDYNQSYTELVRASDKEVALIELIIGPAFSNSTAKVHHDGTREGDYLFYLNQGYRLGPSVGQDNHKRNWGLSTHARLGTWATELSKEGIFIALRSRRTYATEDENMRVKLTLGDAWMGGTARVEEGAEVELALSVSDPDETSADYTAVLFYDDAVGGAEAREVDFATFSGDADTSFTHAPELGGYYFARVKQRSNAETVADDAWTSPIWIAPLEDTDPGEEHAETDEISWDEAEDFVGQEKVVVGRIVQTFNSGSVLFLNFDPDFREHLTLVIFQDSFAAFGGADALEQEVAGKEVKVRGEIMLFQGRPQIIVRSPAQILEMN